MPFVHLRCNPARSHPCGDEPQAYRLPEYFDVIDRFRSVSPDIAFFIGFYRGFSPAKTARRFRRHPSHWSTNRIRWRLFVINIRRGPARRRRDMQEMVQRLKWTSDWSGSRV